MARPAARPSRTTRLRRFLGAAAGVLCAAWGVALALEALLGDQPFHWTVALLAGAGILFYASFSLYAHSHAERTRRDRPY